MNRIDYLKKTFCDKCSCRKTCTRKDRTCSWEERAAAEAWDAAVDEMVSVIRENWKWAISEEECEALKISMKGGENGD